MKRRGAVLLFAVVAAVGLCLGPAGATGFRGGHAHALVVDDDLRGCHGWRAEYRTIQSAIDDPETEAGATIWVCPGLYEETVRVTKPGLTIKGANAGRDATAGQRRHESIVTHRDDKGTVQLLEDDLTWDGFTVRGVPHEENGEANGPGMYTSPVSSGYSILNTVFEDNGIDLHLGSDGAHPTVVCGNLFSANNEFEGAGGANGIYSNEGARKVLITSNRFERHNTSAIFFADIDEDPATPHVLQQDILIEGNTSVDDLSFAVIYNSSRARLTGNDIRARVGDEDFPGPASAIRIGARSHDVVVDRNRIRSASGNGIDVTDSGEPRREESAPTEVLVLKNKVQQAELLGIDVSASGVREYEVRDNRVLANGKVGIHLGPHSDDARITGNTALGNGGDDGLDCQDESEGESATDGTAGTENTWQENVGATADPRAICSPPADDDQPAGDGKHHGKKHHGQPHKQHKGHKEHKTHRQDPCGCIRLSWRF